MFWVNKLDSHKANSNVDNSKALNVDGIAAHQALADASV